jgi:hypothetical protein
LKSKKYVWIAVGVLVAVAIFPLRTTVTTEARVRVLDEAGAPAPDLLVEQEWKDVTVEDNLHMAYERTDQHGFVFFPARTVRSSSLVRLVTATWRFLTQGVHASTGSHGTITVYEKDPYVWGWTAYQLNGNTWPSEIRLKRSETPIYPKGSSLKTLHSETQNSKLGSGLQFCNSCPIGNEQGVAPEL